MFHTSVGAFAFTMRHALIPLPLVNVPAGGRECSEAVSLPDSKFALRTHSNEIDPKP